MMLKPSLHTNTSQTMLNSANYIHLRRLFHLRNLALIGQIVAVIFTLNVLQIDLPIKKISLIFLLFTFFNFFVWLRLKRPRAVTENEIFIHLTVDVLALALLLYFTGGATNPFVMIFLFPLTITVTILPVRYAWLLATITVICYSLLMFYYQPLPIGHSSHGDNGASEYNLHLIGMWMVFILNACLITYYVYGMGNTLRHQQKQLTSAREQSIRDEQLVILGTLAASTAHELGTPLGTMALLVNEIEQELENADAAVLSDLDNLKKQINRCKLSLTDLSASVGASSSLFDSQQQPVCQYLQGIINEIHAVHSNINLSFHCNPDISNSLYTDRTLSLSLINIIDNAIEASPEFVDISVSSPVENSTDFIQIEISDHGPGLSDEALDKIGQQPYSEKELGLGLGLYLAYAAIRRRNGSISQQNCKPEGSKTTIILPLVTI